jgi:hypothetical protein
MDLVDIDRADAVLFFAEPHGSMNKGGGRYFELGYAYCRGLRCVAVGEREIIFLYLPRIHVCATREEALVALSG